MRAVDPIRLARRHINRVNQDYLSCTFGPFLGDIDVAESNIDVAVFWRKISSRNNPG